MRCECCNKPLSDREATAKFARESAEEQTRYVCMCTECQGFLPASVKVLTRSDLSDSVRDFDDAYDKYVDDLFLNDFGGDDD